VEFVQKASGASNVYNYYESPSKLGLKIGDYVYIKSKQFQHRPSQLIDFDLPKNAELVVDLTRSLALNAVGANGKYNITIRNLALGQQEPLQVQGDYTVGWLRKQIMKKYLASG